MKPAWLLLCLLFVPPAKAERVISLAPHLTELVCAVGACEQLVAVDEHSDYPASARALPRIGNAFAVNAEAVLALKPSLILAWEGGTPVAIVPQLRRLGLRVETIRTESLDDVGLALLKVGALLGTEDAACVAEADYRHKLAALRERYAARTPIEVFYQLGEEPMFTVNRASPISAAIELCGGRNIFAAQPRLAGAVGREAVIAADPAAIVFGTQDSAASIRAGWARFPGLRAVRAHNLVAIDADRLARATPRMAEGAAELCAALDAARARLTGAAAQR